jgi:prephenate dehydratase
MAQTNIIYALGPEGTFSDQAARRAQLHARTAAGVAPELVYTRTIPEALERASRDPNACAVAPIENSEAGPVLATQDNLAKYDLVIEWEINLRIHFNLLAHAPLTQVTRLYTHPVAQQQCDVFLAARLPSVETLLTRSNIDSAERWAASPDEPSAAVVPSEYVPAREPALVLCDIQNDQENTTRFVILRPKTSITPDFRRRKTSLLIEPDADRPGLLFEILSVFKKYEINLCRIESRPARTRPWAYVFYLDITNNARAPEAVLELRSHPWQTVLLGTYDALPDPAESVL